MRICILTTATTAHQMGGTEVHAESLAAEAARQGHTVFVLTSAHPDGLETERKSGYTVNYLRGTSHRMSRQEAPAWWKASAAAAAELCSAEKIDVVWAENFAGISYAALPPKDRRPVISVVQGLAVRGEIASNFSRVSTPGELLYFLTRYVAQTAFYYIPRFRSMVRNSDLLIGVSNETARALAEEFPESTAKTKVIFNPVDTALFRPDAKARAEARAELGLGPGDPVILMAGVINKQKGMHLGVEAFRLLADKHPALRLLITGDGPEKPALEAVVSRAGLAEKVFLGGQHDNGDMPRFYNAADIFLNPTLRGEGLAVVNAEAMACGLPCVTSLAGGTGSTIEDGVSGFFVKPGDTGAMAGRLDILLGNEELLKKFSTSARAKALRDFDLKKNLQAYVKASRELTDRQD